LVIVPFQTEEAPFGSFELIFYVTLDRLLHLMTTLRSISDSTRFMAWRSLGIGNRRI